MPDLIVVEAAAKIMKTGTAAKERGERREQPQRPWPDVQPLASDVPRPVQSAPAKRPIEGAGDASKAEGSTAEKKAPAASRPPRKDVLLTSNSPITTDLSAPEFPAILPLKSMRRPEAVPRKRPPRTAWSGANVSVVGREDIVLGSGVGWTAKLWPTLRPVLKADDSQKHFF